MLPYSYNAPLLLLCYQYTAEIPIINPVIVLSLANPDQFHRCKQAMGLGGFQRGLGGIGGGGTLNQNDAMGVWRSSMTMLYIVARPYAVRLLSHQTINRTPVPTKTTMCFSAAIDSRCSYLLVNKVLQSCAEYLVPSHIPTPNNRVRNASRNKQWFRGSKGQVPYGKFYYQGIEQATPIQKRSFPFSSTACQTLSGALQ